MASQKNKFVSSNASISSDCVYQNNKIVLFSGYTCIKKNCHVQKVSPFSLQCFVSKSMYDAFTSDLKRRRVQFQENGLAICITHLDNKQATFIKKNKVLPDTTLTVKKGFI